jgi:hypothetical protein
VVWTAIWTVLAFVSLLLLFHGETILVLAAEQLHQGRAHRLRAVQERTGQTLIASSATRPSGASSTAPTCDKTRSPCLSSPTTLLPCCPQRG